MLQLLVGIPEEVLFFQVLPCLLQEEVVRGLSETSKEMCALLRGRFAVMVDVYPFEELWTAGWKVVKGARLKSTPWGWSIEFTHALRKIDGSDFYSFQDIKDRQYRVPFQGHHPLSVFKVSTIVRQTLKNLELHEIVLDRMDLKQLPSFKSVESLTLKRCCFEADIEELPPKLKRLYISCSNEQGVRIGMLPDTLEFFECGNSRIFSKGENGLSIPASLLCLEVSFNGNSYVHAPLNLRKLSVTEMNTGSLFPVIHLLTLEYLDLRNCFTLSKLSELPPSIRMLRLEVCKMIKTVQLPAGLEGLECNSCEMLEIDFTSLPTALKKLSVTRCNRMESLTSLDMLPKSLEDVTLADFKEIITIPNFPRLRSLTLRNCWKLQILPTFPETLQKLSLVNLEKLKTGPFLPDGLLHLAISECQNFTTIHIPCKLRILKVERSPKLEFLESSFPETLEVLVITRCEKVAIDFFCLPNGLKELHIEGRDDITSISRLPARLRKLTLKFTKGLKILPDLPEDLQKFSLQNCDSLTAFPTLPSNLKVLELRKNKQIQFIGLENEPMGVIGVRTKLPETLRVLDLSECKGLGKIGEFPPNLSCLNLQGCTETLLLGSLPQNLQFLFT